MTMKLFGGTTSAYVRKIKILTGALGLPVESVDDRTPEGAAALAAVSPCGKVPVLVVDGPAPLVLPDSSLIASWLWNQHGTALRAAGFDIDPTHWEDRALQMAVEVALDAAINCFYLLRDGFEDKGYVTKQGKRVETTLAWLSHRVTFTRPVGLAALSLGCALDWMVFRKVTDVARHPGLVAFGAAWAASGVGRGTEPQ